MSPRPCTSPFRWPGMNPAAAPNCRWKPWRTWRSSQAADLPRGHGAEDGGGVESLGGQCALDRVLAVGAHLPEQAPEVAIADAEVVPQSAGHGAGSLGRTHRAGEGPLVRSPGCGETVLQNTFRKAAFRKSARQGPLEAPTHVH